MRPRSPHQAFVLILLTLPARAWGADTDACCCKAGITFGAVQLVQPVQVVYPYDPRFPVTGDSFLPNPDDGGAFDPAGTLDDTGPLAEGAHCANARWRRQVNVPLVENRRALLFGHPTRETLGQLTLENWGCDGLIGTAAASVKLRFSLQPANTQIGELQGPYTIPSAGPCPQPPNCVTTPGWLDVNIPVPQGFPTGGVSIPAGTTSVRVEIVDASSGAAIADTCPLDQVLDTEVSTRATRTMQVCLTPVLFEDWEQAWFGTVANAARTKQLLQQLANMTEAFVPDVFPLPDGGYGQFRLNTPVWLSFSEATSFEEFDDLSASAKDELRVRAIQQLDYLRSAGQCDRMVAMVPPRWFMINWGVQADAIGLWWSDSAKGVVWVVQPEAASGGLGSTVAHEIGHTLGLRLGSDPEEYVEMPPAYEASGYAVADNVDKQSRACFMGARIMNASDDLYWIDKEEYGRLLDKFDDPVLDPEVLWIGGTLTSPAPGTYAVEAPPWRYLPTGTVSLAEGASGELTVRALDAADNALFTAGFDVSFDGGFEPAEGSAPLTPVTFLAAPFGFTIPWQPDAAAIVILDAGEREIYRRSVSASAPAVQLTVPPFAAPVTEGDTVALAWTANDPDGDALAYDVLYSADGGVSWSVLALAQSGTSFSWDTAGAGTGTAFRVRVQAGDGVRTARAESEDFAIAAPADADDDGLPDTWEAANGVSDPTADDDADGLTNQDEYERGANPQLGDSDGDGLGDADEVGLYGTCAGARRACSTTEPNVADSDADGMPDGWEATYSLDAADPRDLAADPDGDDYANVDEYRGGSDPTDPDSVPPGVSAGGAGPLLALLSMAGLVMLRHRRREGMRQ